jgi:protein required for attachment to host cells
MSPSLWRDNKPMILRSEVWFLLADARQARLLCCGLTLQDRCHVDECDSIRNDWSGHTHTKPSPLWKRTEASDGGNEDEVREPTNRFARQLVAWLHHKMAQYEIDRIVILAPPHFLGVLRNEQSTDLASKAIEHKGELTNLSASELAEHPAVRELVGLD